MSGHKLSSLHNVWLDISSDTPVIIKTVSDSGTAVNIPGVIWCDTPSTADPGASVGRASVLMVMDNLAFNPSTGQVTLMSSAFIALYARCMHAIGTAMHPPPLGIVGTELVRAVRSSPKLDKYPFKNTNRAPCKSLYHSDSRQTDGITMDSRSPSRAQRCTSCFEVEFRIRRASWCSKLFIQTQCCKVLADELCAFMDRQLTYHRLWAMLHTGDINVASRVTKPFVVDCPMILATALPARYAANRMLVRAFPIECQHLRRMLASTRLDVGREMTRGLYEDGWHPAKGMSRKMKFPHGDYWKYSKRASGDTERAVVHNHYVELVRYANTASVRLVASGIGREFGSVRPDWFGPAHKMPLSEFIERIRTKPPKVIYGNVTLSVEGSEPYPGGIRAGRWFSHLWTTANRALVVLAPVGPEHMSTQFDETSITAVNNELQGGVWNLVPANIDHDLVRRIQKGNPQNKRKRSPSRGPPPPVIVLGPRRKQDLHENEIEVLSLPHSKFQEIVRQQVTKSARDELVRKRKLLMNRYSAAKSALRKQGQIKQMAASAAMTEFYKGIASALSDQSEQMRRLLDHKTESARLAALAVDYHVSRSSDK
jgi:hypothetical protein